VPPSARPFAGHLHQSSIAAYAAATATDGRLADELYLHVPVTRVHPQEAARADLPRRSGRQPRGAREHDIVLHGRSSR